MALRQPFMNAAAKAAMPSGADRDIHEDSGHMAPKEAGPIYAISWMRDATELTLAIVG